MSAVTRPRARSSGLGRRVVLGLAGLALLAVFAFSTWSFAWPESEVRGEVAIGRTEAFAPGSVTGYLLDDGRLRELPVAEDYDLRPPGYPAIGADLFYVVRFPNGEFRVFSGAAPFRGSTVVWYRQDQVEVDGWVGLFAEGRRGSRWAIDGTRVFGPAPRNLDHYAFRIRGDGVLVVDLADRLKGAGGRYHTAPPYDVSSEDWPTSGWPSG